MSNWSNNQGGYRPSFGGFTFFPPVIKYVIVANVIMYLIQQLATGGLMMDGEPISLWFKETFYLMPIGDGFRVWQLVSYMFLHGGFWHIFINMLMLWMFGVEVENTWGSKKFFYFYFVCGIAAGLANEFIAPIFTGPSAAIGASGSVYGVLMAFGMMFPNRLIYVYFLIPVKAKYMIAFLFMLEVFNGFFMGGEGSGVAHFAHLGGAVIAVVWVLMDRNGLIDQLLRTGYRRRRDRFTRDSVSMPVQDATVYDIGSGRKSAPLTGEQLEYQKTIDAILDKISRNGYAGLTESEKNILLDASRKIGGEDKER